MRPGIICNLETTIIENENVIFRKEERVHSFIKNFAYLMLHGMDGASNSDYTDINNISRTSGYTMDRHVWNDRTVRSRAGLNCVALAAGEVDRGIVVGSSNAEFLVSQHNLQSPIGNGSNLGQLSYALMNTPEDPVYLDPSIILEIDRDIANNSSAEITIREIGLMGYPVYLASAVDASCYSVNASVLFLRDVVADEVVAPGQVLNVKYILKTTV